ncbi:MAG TPA: lysophospholipid acyltransferase family protein [Spirochaetota bacterium]|mgnify:CR=1 FL=1|nr:lysophospholipid acyltransferase family protein [Spirochaetota bacterium]
MLLEKKKINKIIIFRLVVAWTFWTVVFFPLLFIPRRFHYGIFWKIFSGLFLWANKIKVKYASDIDLNNLSEPVIFAANHKGYFDAYVIINLLRKPFSIVYNESMDRNPFYKLVARKMGLVPLRRDLHYSQKDSFSKITNLIDKKYSIIMFPEGWHIIDNEIAQFKRGIAKIAKDTGVAVMPMAIYGLNDNFRYEKKLFWRTVYIKTSSPIKYNQYNDDDLFLKDLRERVAELYKSLEKEYGNQERSK